MTKIKYYFRLINNDSDDIIYENGLNFGESFDDDFTYLRPIVRCCSIGDSNLQTLLRYVCLSIFK